VLVVTRRSGVGGGVGLVTRRGGVGCGAGRTPSLFNCKYSQGKENMYQRPETQMC
jgi:hypothetical protein